MTEPKQFSSQILKAFFNIGTAAIQYRPDIDGLRAVAVLAVVLNHLSASLLPGGYVGVDVFFVISGYLITGIIGREIAEGQFTFAGFYERRARRIFPALFAMLLATLVVSYFVLLPSDMVSTLRGALGTVFFTSNMVFWREMKEGYFAATDMGLNPLLHTWSLAVEEQFYLLFPILLLLCFKYARRYIVAVLVVCAIASLAAAALMIGSKGVAVFFPSPFRAWELLVGSLLALNIVPALRSHVWRELLAGAGLLSIVVSCFVYNDRTTFPGLAALAPVLGTAAILHAGASGSSLVARLLQLRPMVYVGLISYSLYLWHWPLIVLVRYAMGMAPITQYLPFLFVASLGLGSLSYHLIEQPFRKKGLVSRGSVWAVSVAFVCLFTVVSGIGLMRGGFETRFTPEVIQLDKARWPKIPHQECNAKSANAWCRLGVDSHAPTSLFWGDSHLLSWAPALNKVMNTRDEKALFITSSACPPLFGVSSSLRPSCEAENLDVKNYLLANPHIKKVVIAGFWSTYFQKNNDLIARDGNQIEKGTQAASHALASTIQWLRDNKRQVVVIGPVPIYEYSVPMALALEKASGHQVIFSSQADQKQKHAAFFEVVNAAEAASGTPLHFLDPIQWLCSPDCIVVQDGVSLYRDAHHLSVAGAMLLEPQLTDALKVLSNP
jgi:peptidoglycan/LPS O-acetylase OafA/YrhL